MSTDGLSLSFLEGLINEPDSLNEDAPKIHGKVHPRVFQNGPLRFFEEPLTCTNLRCGSPTHMKVQGVPRCMMHSLQRLNELLIAEGVSLNDKVPRS